MRAYSNRLESRLIEVERALQDELDNWNPKRRPTIAAELAAAEVKLAAQQEVVEEARRLSRVEADGWLPNFMPLAEALRKLDAEEGAT